MERYALITGTSSGIGQALGHLLLRGISTFSTDQKDCWQVYGLCRHPERFWENLSLDLPAPPISEPEYRSRYHPIVCDLTDRRQVVDAIRNLRRECTLDLLVNNAGIGYFGPHEELSVEKLHQMIAVNIEAPLLLTQLLLQDLKKSQGAIFNLSSVTAQKTDNTHGCAYGATKAALSSFSSSLFEEVRKYGVRVLTLQPDMTESGFYTEANFEPERTPDTCLGAVEVAKLAVWMLSMRTGSLVTSLTVRPQKHRIKRKSHNLSEGSVSL